MARNAKEFNLRQTSISGVKRKLLGLLINKTKKAFEKLAERTSRAG